MKNVLGFLLVTVLAVALAHSKAIKITPANGSSVVAPKTVSITFDEGIEGNFSTFKVYIYTGQVNNSAMASFVKAKLPLRNDAATRADTGNNAKGGTKNVVISLKPNLKAGVYMVMWRILGEDTHTVDAWSFFRIKEK